MDCVLFYGNTYLPGILRPAGPARLATELRDAGFETVSIDIGGLKDTHFNLIERIINKFITPSTLWVGISTTFLTDIFGVRLPRIDDIYKELIFENDMLLIQFIDLCKQKNPNIKFIIGGGFFINLSKYGFYHFRGYADYELVEFTKWCKDRSYSPKINRLGRVIECNEYSNFVNSTIKWHKTDIIKPTDTLPIEISRGCIFKCKFCAFPLNGKTKGEWIKNFEILKNEFIYNYEKYGVTRYIFADDTYNDSRDKILNLYEHVYSKLPFKLDITCYLRLDLMYRFRDTADILSKSGIRSAMFGLETNNNESAKLIGKGLSFDKQIDYLKELKKKEFNNTLVGSGFIFGLPRDTVESMNELENFLLSNDNPFDDWICKPLGLNPIKNSAHRKYFSEFDLEHEKYGYQLIGSDPAADIYRMKWKLNDTIDYDYCFNQASRINRISNLELTNFKYASQDYGRMCSIIDRKEIITLGRCQINRKYDVKSLVKNYIVNYYNELLRI